MTAASEAEKPSLRRTVRTPAGKEHRSGSFWVQRKIEPYSY